MIYKIISRWKDREPYTHENFFRSKERALKEIIRLVKDRETTACLLSLNKIGSLI